MNSDTLIDATFLSATGTVMNVKDVIREDECWNAGKTGKKILSHRAIQKIATLAGISKNYKVDESPMIQPTYKNELEHIVRVTINCKAKKSGKGCLHDILDRTLTVTGEANKLNTPIMGRTYLRKMAEKRAFDIAVLEHLGLYSSLFSEEESVEFSGTDVLQHQSINITNVELEAMRATLNDIVQCKTSAELLNVQVMVDSAKSAYSDKQYSYLVYLLRDRIDILNADKKAIA